MESNYFKLLVFDFRVKVCLFIYSIKAEVLILNYENIYKICIASIESNN